MWRGELEMIAERPFLGGFVRSMPEDCIQLSIVGDGDEKCPLGGLHKRKTAHTLPPIHSHLSLPSLTCAH